MNDDFLFFEEELEDTPLSENPNIQKWKIIIVDDEEEVHAVTKLALSDFTFHNKGLEFISAYSGEEAKQTILAHQDAAVILLDVVMETDDAGLKVVDFIRNQANNHFVRVILRTGQPGQAPERQVIVNYDINDYKSKTELTAQKLFTVVMSSLRSYRDIMALEKNRAGLETIIQASANLFSNHSMESFIQGLLRQLTSIISCSDEAMYITSLVADDETGDGQLVVVAGQGEFSGLEGKHLFDVIAQEQKLDFDQAIANKSIVYGHDYIIAYCQSRSTRGALLYISNIAEALSETDKHLIELFTQNVQIAFDNVLLTQEIEDTQKEVVFRMSEAVECRSKETGNHVKRVAQYCRVLAEKLNLPNATIEELVLASPLHDIGKIGISDKILHKPGKLTDEERNIMQKHAELGYKILQNSNKAIISAGAIISLDHHEKWDGTGYPNRKKAEDIHLYGRIVAIADVYDALRNERCYKKAWSVADTLEHIEEQSGKHFDPQLVDIMLTHINEFEKILLEFPDTEEAQFG
ncbi:DUF3369 domain-containing protein [Catenovulum sp. 2E275]|uniref:DUF3369 domain-containing protein n=1 Tax=Catenovulum sp. 2E275 TaxID=2980497 RepID=UPI0021D23C57|nr:DUF3369 domain-containing protein [Catenovulum sp. 2E275]MCU4675354.1 DUF3369 domain-containing protein [Catenovulum sp. 2E275]